MNSFLGFKPQRDEVSHLCKISHEEFSVAKSPLKLI